MRFNTILWSFLVVAYFFWATLYNLGDINCDVDAIHPETGSAKTKGKKPLLPYLLYSSLNLGLKLNLVGNAFHYNNVYALQCKMVPIIIPAEKIFQPLPPPAKKNPTY